MPNPQAHSTPRRRGPALAALVGGLTASTVAVVLWTGRTKPPDLAAQSSNTAPKPNDPAKAAEVLAAVEKFRAQGEVKKAETILRAAATDYPEDQSFPLALAELLVADRRLSDAYASYEKALSIGPADALLEFAAGTVANMIGRTDRAIEHYSAAQAADKADPRFPLYLAMVQAKKGQIVEAKANLLIAGKLNPDNATVWGTLADLSLRENAIPLALQHIAKARDLEPEATVWRVIEARAFKRGNKPEQALGVLIGLSPMQRLEDGVLSTMGECYGLLGRPEDATKIYREAVDLQPLDGALTLEYARWLERSGQLQEALSMAKRSVTLLAPGAAEVVTRLEGK